MIDWKLCGMGMVVCASLWTGCQAAAGVRRCCRALEQLRLSLELMRCEISCRLTPARKLAGILSDACKGEVAVFYAQLEHRLLQGDEVPQAARTAMRESRLQLPPEVAAGMDELFASFGSYDAEGQLALIELTQTRVADALRQLSAEQRQRCRSYELLGLCAGLSLAILVA